MSHPQIRDAGDAGLLLEFEAVIDPEVNARAIAVADAVRAAAMPGVRDVVSTYRSVAVHLDPLVCDRTAARNLLQQLAAVPATVQQGVLLEIPVAYGGNLGPDLEWLATRAGLSAEQVIALHLEREYRVFMLGFLPGFAYMGTVDERIAAPRREMPRTHVPRGSVGVAGGQTGVYPMESPGGWQLIGQSPLPMFDIARSQPALCRPGDRVRFVRVAPPAASAPVTNPAVAEPEGPVALTVVQPGLLTTVQDEGRWGHQSTGVPVAGALDLAAHRRANAVVGNPRGAATLEATVIGPELRVERTLTAAISGADLTATMDGRAVPLDTPVRVPPGSVVRFAGRRSGARAYLAFEGGIDVPLVLGSRATHVRSGMGGLRGRALHAGDRIAAGSQTPTDARAPVAAAGTAVRSGGAVTAVTLRVTRGPHDDWFPDEAFAALEETAFSIQPHSDRMGFRLTSDRLIPRLSRDEMISDATFGGGLQVPPSGQPILLMSDRQTTGGYPMIGVVITADLPLAGQLLPGDRVRFQLCSMSDALAALRAAAAEMA